MGILFALLSATAFSISNIAIKKGNQRSSSGDTGFFLTVIINVVVLGIIFFISQLIKGFTFSFNLTAFLFFVLAGGITTGVGRLSLFSSIGKIGAVRAPAIKNAAPIFSVLFGLLILGETVTLVSMFGMVLLMGAILLQGKAMIEKLRKSKMKEVAATLEQQQADTDQRNQWIGYLLAVLAAFCFGMGQGIRKQGLLVLDDAFFGAFVGVLTSLTFFVIYDACRGRLISTIKRNFTELNPYYLIAGVVTSLGPLFFFLGAAHMEVAYVSVIAGVEPLITTILSAIYLKGQENLTSSVWVSVFLVLCGTMFIALGT